MSSSRRLPSLPASAWIVSGFPFFKKKSITPTHRSFASYGTSTVSHTTACSQPSIALVSSAIIVTAPVVVVVVVMGPDGESGRMDGGRPCRAVAAWRHCRRRPFVPFRSRVSTRGAHVFPFARSPAPADVSCGNGSPRVTAVATGGRVHTCFNLLITGMLLIHFIWVRILLAYISRPYFGLEVL